ncbi:hypothetical protein HNY73_007559 [Argiope bruennichi]|uniref:Immunoglobulin domain-containing protein n=1 Tax=Argiope bruennichi TaxID=94029 RepID=A0A8T0FLD9_ARGBR|nr:hypothetical protein HNY73_007559 [Argiope bruennichi]
MVAIIFSLNLQTGQSNPKNPSHSLPKLIFETEESIKKIRAAATIAPESTAEIVKELEKLNKTVEEKKNNETDEQPCNKEACVQMKKENVVLKKAEVLKDMMLKPAYPCEEWDKKYRICYLNRNVGNSVTFVLAIPPPKKTGRVRIEWKQEFAALKPHKNKTYHINPNIGLVYPGSTLALRVASYISLPSDGMTFKWELDSDRGFRFAHLPSNMRPSPTGSSLRVSELRKEQEGLLVCRIYTNLGIHAAAILFDIYKVESDNNQLVYVATRPPHKSKTRDKRSPPLDSYSGHLKNSTGNERLVNGKYPFNVAAQLADQPSIKMSDFKKAWSKNSHVSRYRIKRSSHSFTHSKHSADNWQVFSNGRSNAFLHSIGKKPSNLKKRQNDETSSTEEPDYDPVIELGNYDHDYDEYDRPAGEKNQQSSATPKQKSYFGDFDWEENRRFEEEAKSRATPQPQPSKHLSFVERYRQALLARLRGNDLTNKEEKRVEKKKLHTTTEVFERLVDVEEDPTLQPLQERDRMSIMISKCDRDSECSVDAVVIIFSLNVQTANSNPAKKPSRDSRSLTEVISKTEEEYVLKTKASSTSTSTMSPESKTDIVAKLKNLIRILKGKSKTETQDKPCNKESCLQITKENSALKKDYLLKSMMLKPAYPCDEWIQEKHICFLNRSVGNSVTFVLATPPPETTGKVRIEWLQEFATLDPNKFKTYHINPTVGLVYPGATMTLHMPTFINLPSEGMTFKWTLNGGSENSLPSNMRTSPSGASLRISELRKEQEGIVSCSAYTNLGVHATHIDFSIRQVESDNNKLIFIPTRPPHTFLPLDKRKRREMLSQLETTSKTPRKIELTVSPNKLEHTESQFLKRPPLKFPHYKNHYTSRRRNVRSLQPDHNFVSNRDSTGSGQAIANVNNVTNQLESELLVYPLSKISEYPRIQRKDDESLFTPKPDYDGPMIVKHQMYDPNKNIEFKDELEFEDSSIEPENQLNVPQDTGSINRNRRNAQLNNSSDHSKDLAVNEKKDSIVNSNGYMHEKEHVPIKMVRYMEKRQDYDYGGNSEEQGSYESEGENQENEPQNQFSSAAPQQQAEDYNPGEYPGSHENKKEESPFGQQDQFNIPTPKRQDYQSPVDYHEGRIPDRMKIKRRKVLLVNKISLTFPLPKRQDYQSPVDYHGGAYPGSHEDKKEESPFGQQDQFNIPTPKRQDYQSPVDYHAGAYPGSHEDKKEESPFGQQDQFNIPTPKRQDYQSPVDYHAGAYPGWHEDKKEESPFGQQDQFNIPTPKRQDYQSPIDYHAGAYPGSHEDKKEENLFGQQDQFNIPTPKRQDYQSPFNIPTPKRQDYQSPVDYHGGSYPESHEDKKEERTFGQQDQFNFPTPKQQDYQSQFDYNPGVYPGSHEDEIKESTSEQEHLISSTPKIESYQSPSSRKMDYDIGSYEDITEESVVEPQSHFEPTQQFNELPSPYNSPADLELPEDKIEESISEQVPISSPTPKVEDYQSPSSGKMDYDIVSYEDVTKESAVEPQSQLTPSQEISELPSTYHSPSDLELHEDEIKESTSEQEHLISSTPKLEEYPSPSSHKMDFDIESFEDVTEESSVEPQNQFQSSQQISELSSTYHSPTDIELPENEIEESISEQIPILSPTPKLEDYHFPSSHKMDFDIESFEDVTEGSSVESQSQFASIQQISDMSSTYHSPTDLELPEDEIKEGISKQEDYLITSAPNLEDYESPSAHEMDYDIEYYEYVTGESLDELQSELNSVSPTQQISEFLSSHPSVDHVPSEEELKEAKDQFYSIPPGRLDNKSPLAKKLESRPPMRISGLKGRKKLKGDVIRPKNKLNYAIPKRKNKMPPLNRKLKVRPPMRISGLKGQYKLKGSTIGPKNKLNYAIPKRKNKKPPSNKKVKVRPPMKISRLKGRYKLKGSTIRPKGKVNYATSKRKQKKPLLNKKLKIRPPIRISGLKDRYKLKGTIIGPPNQLNYATPKRQGEEPLLAQTWEFRPSGGIGGRKEEPKLKSSIIAPQSQLNVVIPKRKEQFPSMKTLEFRPPVVIGGLKDQYELRGGTVGSQIQLNIATPKTEEVLPPVELERHKEKYISGHIPSQPQYQLKAPVPVRHEGEFLTSTHKWEIQPAIENIGLEDEYELEDISIGRQNQLNFATPFQEITKSPSLPKLDFHPSVEIGEDEDEYEVEDISIGRQKQLNFATPLQQITKSPSLLKLDFHPSVEIGEHEDESEVEDISIGRQNQLNFATPFQEITKSPSLLKLDFHPSVEIGEHGDEYEFEDISFRPKIQLYSATEKHKSHFGDYDQDEYKHFETEAVKRIIPGRQTTEPLNFATEHKKVVQAWLKASGVKGKHIKTVTQERLPTSTGTFEGMVSVEEDLQQLQERDKLAMLIGKCIRDSECSQNAMCVKMKKDKPGFCRCLPKFEGNGIFCWEGDKWII